jgi:hypothetical protein
MLDLSMPPVDLRGQVVSGFVSAHTDSQCRRPDKVYVRCQGNNIGIGYNTEAGWAFGVYRNSINRASAYVAYEEVVVQPQPIGMVVGLGLATGYRHAVVPIAYPGLLLRAGRWDVVVGGAPKMPNTTPGFVWAQVRYSLK